MGTVVPILGTEKYEVVKCQKRERERERERVKTLPEV